MVAKVLEGALSIYHSAAKIAIVQLYAAAQASNILNSCMVNLHDEQED